MEKDIEKSRNVMNYFSSITYKNDLSIYFEELFRIVIKQHFFTFLL